MFLLDKEPKIINVPWPLAIIDDCLPADAANYLRDNFPKIDTQKGSIEDFYQHQGPAKMDDPVFKFFFEENWYQRKKINDMAHDILEMQTKEAELTRFNYTYFPAGDPLKPIRDWHTDMFDKRIQFILYLGYNSNDITLECGDGNKSFFKMPFVHNRLIFWNSTKDTWHRFFHCKKERYTINLTSQTAQSNTNYLGLKNYVS